ncbi:MAG: HD domain-containing protein [Lactobacillaceae bacterium]|jgi:hypothetical protein|nr:HD domain-containing protein [Lactobacillaceae bacterium]
MLEAAKRLLKERYNECRRKVGDKGYFAHFADEKLHHSMQVFGLGKYIYKHEFLNKTAEFKGIALTSVLLHDIGRFKEFEELFKRSEGGGHNVKYDHSQLGYEMLKDMPEFNDVRIILPIKHHGHLLEDFYSDEEYKSIEDDALKNEVEEILFLVRDADKMANMYFFVDAKDILDTMLYKIDVAPLSDEMKKAPISEKVFSGFMAETVINNRYAVSAPDQAMRFLAWLFDINYRTSYDYFEKHKLLKKYIAFLRYYQIGENDSFIIEKKIKEYITKRYEQLKG